MSVLSALSADLYEFTMVGGYYASGLTGRATFDLSVRQLPANRQFLVAAGIEQALEFLEGLRFTPGDIRFLRHIPALAPFPSDFFDDYLAKFRFTGDVWAVEEGTPIYVIATEKVEQEIEDARRRVVAAEQARKQLLQLRPEARKRRELGEQGIEDRRPHGLCTVMVTRNSLGNAGALTTAAHIVI